MSGRTIYEVPIVNEVTGDMKFPVSDGNVLPQTASLEQVSQFVQNPIKDYIRSLLEGYVKVVEGKGLSTNDFTNTLKEKLNGLENYDDSAVKTQISRLQTTLDSIVSGDASSAIESLNEIMAFLENIEDSETLEGILAGLMAQMTKLEQNVQAAFQEMYVDTDDLTEYNDVF